MIVIFFFYLHFTKSKKELNQIEINNKEENYSSNIIDGVNYLSKDAKGNEYIINAEKGEIDISNSKNLDKYFKKIDYVFHLAGIADIVPSIENPNKYCSNKKSMKVWKVFYSQ